MEPWQKQQVGYLAAVRIFGCKQSVMQINTVSHILQWQEHAQCPPFTSEGETCSEFLMVLKWGEYEGRAMFWQMWHRINVFTTFRYPNQFSSDFGHIMHIYHSYFFNLLMSSYFTPSVCCVHFWSHLKQWVTTLYLVVLQITAVITINSWYWSKRILVFIMKYFSKGIIKHGRIKKSIKVIFLW